MGGNERRKIYEMQGSDQEVMSQADTQSRMSSTSVLQFQTLRDETETLATKIDNVSFVVKDLQQNQAWVTESLRKILQQQPKHEVKDLIELKLSQLKSTLVSKMIEITAIVDNIKTYVVSQLVLLDDNCQSLRSNESFSEGESIRGETGDYNLRTAFVTITFDGKEQHLMVTAAQREKLLLQKKHRSIAVETMNLLHPISEQLQFCVDGTAKPFYGRPIQQIPALTMEYIRAVCKKIKPPFQATTSQAQLELDVQWDKQVRGDTGKALSHQRSRHEITADGKILVKPRSNATKPRLSTCTVEIENEDEDAQ